MSWEGRRRALCTQKLLVLRENKRSQCDGNKGTLVHSQPGACKGDEQHWSWGQAGVALGSDSCHYPGEWKGPCVTYQNEGRCWELLISEGDPETTALEGWGLPKSRVDAFLPLHSIIHRFLPHPGLWIPLIIMVCPFPLLGYCDYFYSKGFVLPTGTWANNSK